MLLNTLTFHAPKTLAEASDLFGKLENVRLQAGGTFLLNALKLQKRKGTKTPEHIISLSKVKELIGIDTDKDKMTIKAMTTIDDLFESDLLNDNFAVLKTVCRNISTQPIRNMATVGGNLTCRYTWTEMPAVMIGLNAAMHFDGGSSMEAEKFFKNAAKTDKIFTHVEIKRDPKASIAYRRVKKTQFVDIPLLSLMINTTFNGNQFTNTRVAVNNCVAFAQRDQKLEEFLNNSQKSSTLADEALNHIDAAIYDTRSSDYKSHMFRVSLKSAIAQLVNSK